MDHTGLRGCLLHHWPVFSLGRQEVEEEGRTIINVVISIVIIITVAMQVEDECGDIPMVLVQNKIDLISQSEIDQWVQLDLSIFSTQALKHLLKPRCQPIDISLE